MVYLQYFLKVKKIKKKRLVRTTFVFPPSPPFFPLFMLCVCLLQNEFFLSSIFALHGWMKPAPQIRFLFLKKYFFFMDVALLHWAAERRNVGTDASFCCESGVLSLHSEIQVIDAFFFFPLHNFTSD